MRIPVNKKCIIWLIVVTLLVVGVTLGFYFGFREKFKQSTAKSNGAVVSNGIGCADIGTQIFKDGGCHVDAAIAIALCESVMVPQTMGLGGGFVATLYTKGKVETIIARETAPAAAYQDMFVNKTSIKGGLAIGIPGELRGYWAMHERYGCLRWEKLFTPTIKICHEGHAVSAFLAGVLASTEEGIRNDPGLSEIFLNKNGQLVKEGDIITRIKLGETLARIAKNGVDEIYNGGETGRKLLEDIKSLGGIITAEDLKNYQVRWENSEAWASIRGKYKFHTTPLPTSGPVLAFMLNVMDGYDNTDNSIFWQRAIETFKHAYGLRTNLGDLKMEEILHDLIEGTLKNLTSPTFASNIRSLIFDTKTFTDPEYYGADYSVSEDHGTANMAVIAPNGDAVVLTSTINNNFGCWNRSMQTGIILNDQMDDFSTPGLNNSYGVPASPANYIQPGKMPMSSMCPSIILDDSGNVRMLIGAAGGTKITTSVALAIFKHLWMNETLYDAINEPRLHHQLVPMQIDYDPGVPQDLLNYLSGVGHSLNLLPVGIGFAAVTGISLVNNGIPEPVYDRRRVGSTSIVEMAKASAYWNLKIWE